MDLQSQVAQIVESNSRLEAEVSDLRSDIRELKLLASPERRSGPASPERRSGPFTAIEVGNLVTSSKKLAAEVKSLRADIKELKEVASPGSGPREAAGGGADPTGAARVSGLRR
jgi:uncharacterized protein (UPF0335 family)